MWKFFLVKSQTGAKVTAINPHQNPERNNAVMIITMPDQTSYRQEERNVKMFGTI
jgi:hypothetical protein